MEADLPFSPLFNVAAAPNAAENLAYWSKDALIDEVKRLRGIINALIAAHPQPSFPPIDAGRGN